MPLTQSGFPTDRPYVSDAGNWIIPSGVTSEIESGASLSNLGTSTTGGTAGASGSYAPLTKVLTAIADNSATDMFTVTVPNLTLGAMVQVTAAGSLGDGDSTDSAQYNIGISRIAGAATKAVAGAKLGAGATAGATANSVLTVAVSTMTGATSGAQTFTITVKVARSAGSAANHVVVARIEVLNGLTGGVTAA